MCLQVAPSTAAAGVATLTCKFCGKQFRSEQGLRDHENVHKGKFRYTCPHCPRGFVAINHYKEHLTSHTGISYFQCKQCAAMFSTQYHLKMHRNKEHGGGPRQQSFTTVPVSSSVSPLSSKTPPHRPSVFPSQHTTSPRTPLNPSEMSYGEIVAHQILAEVEMKQQQQLQDNTRTFSPSSSSQLHNQQQQHLEQEELAAAYRTQSNHSSDHTSDESPTKVDT